MNRSAIRELAFKLIYSREIQRQEDIQEQIDLYIEANEINDFSRNITKPYKFSSKRL